MFHGVGFNSFIDIALRIIILTLSLIDILLILQFFKFSLSDLCYLRAQTVFGTFQSVLALRGFAQFIFHSPYPFLCEVLAVRRF